MGQWVTNLGLSLLATVGLLLLGVVGIYLMLIGFAIIGFICVLGTAALLAWASVRARPNNAWR